MIRKHILFEGRVQGVGFRWRASLTAQRLVLTGWVRNLSDGRVEMEVQGKQTTIGALLAELQRDSYIRIRAIESQEISVVEGESKFRAKL